MSWWWHALGVVGKAIYAFFLLTITVIFLALTIFFSDE